MLFCLKTPRCLSFDDFFETASQCQKPFYQFQIISGFKASNPFQQCSDASLSPVPINSGSKDPGLFSVSLRKSDTLSSPQDLSINWFTLVKKQMCVYKDKNTYKGADEVHIQSYQLRVKASRRNPRMARLVACDSLCQSDGSSDQIEQSTNSKSFPLNPFQPATCWFEEIPPVITKGNTTLHPFHAQSPLIHEMVLEQSDFLQLEASDLHLHVPTDHSNPSTSFNQQDLLHRSLKTPSIA